MAKRELIDKKSIMSILNSINYDTDYECDYISHTCDYDEVLEKVEYADVITEEEIVKPYLEKLKERVSKSCYKALITDDGNIKESKVLQIIDNLLTEKGTPLAEETKEESER